MDKPRGTGDPYPEGYEPGWFRCPECGGYWHSSEDVYRKDVAWDMPPECGYCGGIEMERVDVENFSPEKVIRAGLNALTKPSLAEDEIALLKSVVKGFGQKVVGHAVHIQWRRDPHLVYADAMEIIGRLEDEHG